MRFDARREARLLAAAAGFLTRIPVPALAFDPDWLPRSAKYFPLVGALVGVLAAAILLAGGHVWPGPVPAILAVLGALLVTGALHEDGLADTADGLGGRSREARLAIMKDPRLGAYGALALGFCLALRVAALAALPPWSAAVALVGAHAGGRLAAVLLLAAQPYAGDPAAARVSHGAGRPTRAELALAALFGLAPALLLPLPQALLALGLGTAAAGLLAWRVCRALGGQTGDVLGATEAVFETGFLLGAAALVGPAGP